MTRSSPDHPVPSSPKLLLPVVIALGFCVLYFVGLGSYPLFDPDEPVYGQVAREMAGGAGWLSPHLNGALWFDKPPLFYWLSALSVSLFGPTEFACRLPSALGAVGLTALVYALARHDFGKRAALLSAIVIATCLQQIVLARAAVTDMTLAFFLTLALYGYRRWLGADSTRAQGASALLCGVATGLAMLTKGPVAPVLLSVTFALHLWWMGRLSRLLSSSSALAVVAALAVGLPWYLAMYRLHGQEFVQGFLVANNITRFLKAEHAGQTGHWYSIFLNAPVLLIFFFPWSVFVPQAVARAWKSQRRSSVAATSDAPSEEMSKAGLRLALVWFGVVFVFFSLSKTQLVTYIFPLYPAAAILVGVLWSEMAPAPEFATATAATNSRRGVRNGLWGLLLLSLLLSIGLVATAHRKFPAAQGAALGAGVILLISCALSLWLLSRRDSDSHSSLDSPDSPDPKPVQATAQAVPSEAWVVGAGMACLALWLVVGVVPLVTPGQSTRDLVSRLPSQAAQVASYDVRLPSLLFYIRQRPQDHYLGSLDNQQTLQAMRRGEPLFIVCKSSEVSQIKAPGDGQWTASGRLVVLGNASAMQLAKDHHAS